MWLTQCTVQRHLVCCVYRFLLLLLLLAALALAGAWCTLHTGRCSCQCASCRGRAASTARVRIIAAVYSCMSQSRVHTREYCITTAVRALDSSLLTWQCNPVRWYSLQTRCCLQASTWAQTVLCCVVKT
jgi:hypothetical protein